MRETNAQCRRDCVTLCGTHYQSLGAPTSGDGSEERWSVGSSVDRRTVLPRCRPRSAAVLVSRSFGAARYHGVLVIGIPLFGLEFRVEEVGRVEVGAATVNIDTTHVIMG